MSVLFLIGRILFSGFFVASGINHFRHIDQMAGYAKSKGVPMPKFAVGFTGLMLLVGGLSVLLGVYPVVGVWILIVFLLGVTFQMHSFWKVSDPMQKMGDSVNFFKNISLLGALLMMLMLATPWAYVLLAK